MPEHPYHETLRLQNFTVFKDARFDFSPGINAIIGENGSGKTHLLKAMYSWQLACARIDGSPIETFAETFQTSRDTYRAPKLGQLTRLAARASSVAEIASGSLALT